MDARSLRELQAPLKDRYRDEPDAALQTARAEAVLGTGVSCNVDTWSGPTTAGLHRSAGGDGSRACSADMLLEALVACAAVTLNSIATHRGVRLDRAVVRAEGTWDARGTLGVSREAPVGLTDIVLTFELVGDPEDGLDDATRAKLVELTERYCVIYQTLVHPPSVGMRLAEARDDRSPAEG